MKVLLILCFKLAFNITALRFAPSNGTLPDRNAHLVSKSWPWSKSTPSVDTVLVLKTLDTGSTFLDEHIFPSLPGVSRWKEEFNIWTFDTMGPNWQKMIDFFKHQPGERIVGGSYDFASLLNPKNRAKNDIGFFDNVMPHFTNGDFGNVLIIKLYRNPVEKWINILREDPAQSSFACPKDQKYSPECKLKATRIDPAYFRNRVLWNEEIDKNMDNYTADGIKDKPHIVQVERLTYDEILSCQMVPQRISKYFGSDSDGCNATASALYRQNHPKRKMKDIVTNFEELRSALAGSPWESHFVADHLIG